MNEKRQAEWRRNQVLRTTSKRHYPNRDISIFCKIRFPLLVGIYHSSEGGEAKMHVKRTLSERLPEEYEKCLVRLTAILREASTTSQQTNETEKRYKALSLAKECYLLNLQSAYKCYCGRRCHKFQSRITK